MRQHAAIVFSLLLISATSCFAYEVILKNGKVLKGEVIRENQEMLILKDSSGIELKIRPDQIDLEKTTERNRKTEIIQETTEQTQPTAPQETEKSKRKGRVYTKQDLEKMPELSIVGTHETADEAAARNKRQDRSAEKEEDEAAWNAEALRIDDEVQRAKESYDYNRALCDRVIPDMNDLRDGPYVKMTPEQYEEQRRYACSYADSDARDLKNAEAEFEHFQERARKAGVPPGWVDPVRIRN